MAIRSPIRADLGVARFNDVSAGGGTSFGPNALAPIGVAVDPG